MEPVAEIAIQLHGPGGKENRKFLSELCQSIDPGPMKGEKTMNQILIEFYESCGFHDFHTYRQWKEKGKQVKKGEKAFLLWAKPLSSQKEKAPKNDLSEETNEGPEFFPLCYVFASCQVE